MPVLWCVGYTITISFNYYILLSLYVPTGTGFAFIVNDDIACLGGFFVDKQYRQKGIGPMIWDARMKYIGNRDVHLNALSKRAEKDQRLGFKHVLQDIYLMAGMPESRDFNIDEFKSNIDSLIPIKDADLEQLVQYDHTIMKQANRMGYLKTIIQRYNTRGFVATKDGAIVGYVTEMPCSDFVSIGPLYAESPSVGKALLRKFISILPENARVMVAVPETNEKSLSAVRAVGLEKVDFARSMTMKKSYEVEWSRIYGIVNIANWLW